MLIFAATILLARPARSQQGADPFSMHTPVPEIFRPLPLSAIRPSGWLRAAILENLQGFTGHLDSLAPSLMIDDDIYGTDRLTRKVKSKNVGALSDTGSWQVQFLWWNSESQSNWLDGFLRSAILVNDPEDLQRSRKDINRILSTQDPDGYLGIYDRDLRYHFNNENGELWAKTTLLRGLLGWYDYSHDARILRAVERAVQDVMVHYPANASHPFYSVTPYVGGLSHGLMFVDILESLYRLTGRTIYRDYSLFLYKDFSSQTLQEDAQYKKLIDPSYRLQGHGVHTYEHLRAVADAYYASGNPLLGRALQDDLDKIAGEITVTGAPVGDEWIGGRKADETRTGYEYCSLQELMNSFEELMIKTGEGTYGDRIERLFFNAAQGSRDPDASCIAYLKTDNSYYMTGGLNGDTSDKKQTRYSYSPVHQKAAVCCVPNAGRIFPYYVQDMWMKEGDDLVATLLGPCELSTTVAGIPVSVSEITAYPFDNSIEMKVRSRRPVTFSLKIRIPSWAQGYTVNLPGSKEGDFLVVKRRWAGRQDVILHFNARPQVNRDSAGEYYFSYGALVLAHPLKALARMTGNYPLPGFHDWDYAPDSLLVYQAERSPVITTDSLRELRFSTTLLDPVSGKEERIPLVPVAQTILRQVTFKTAHRPSGH